MAQTQHADHDYITARQNRYIEAWKSGSVDKLMEIMSPQDFKYNSPGIVKDELDHSVVRTAFHKTFTDCHNLKLKTRSIHGHKSFTAWEWVVVCKYLPGPDGSHLEKEKAPSKKMEGCTLMWWNDRDRIVRMHDYSQMRDPDEGLEEGFEHVGG